MKEVMVNNPVSELPQYKFTYEPNERSKGASQDIKIYEYLNGGWKLIMTGNVRFDGYSDWETDSLHICSKFGATGFIKLLETIFDEMATVYPDAEL